MSTFNDKLNLKLHIADCVKYHDGESKIEMRKQGTFTQFKNINKMLKVPYLIYADFESVITNDFEIVNDSKIIKNDGNGIKKGDKKGVRDPMTCRTAE